NHGVLRYREPVYLSAEELAMSFFHEYFLDDGRKTLRQYSEPFDLRQLPNSTWLISEENLWDVNQALANCKHFEILSTAQIKRLRPASAIEIAAGKITEWQAPQNKKHR
ncbi:MAG TPA: hypothetical protein PKD79_04430, partial [Candidatus Doudnabacteria bacterium]|nr:hypothetical protein [Candidatus Doudnabacteria bacterium]